MVSVGTSVLRWQVDAHSDSQSMMYSAGLHMQICAAIGVIYRVLDRPTEVIYLYMYHDE